MRRVRIAESARSFFETMLQQGAERFGIAVAQEKERLVDEAISKYLAESPHRGRYDESLRLYFYPITRTPFIVVYEFDDQELRVLFIVHARSDRRRLDVSKVEW